MDSPFTSLLDSNYVATDSELLEIQSLLVLPTSRLEDLSTQLQKLDEQSTQIRNEQSSLFLFISKHRALISLIRRLPIYILQEIFIACLPTTAYNKPGMISWESPILLTQSVVPGEKLLMLLLSYGSRYISIYPCVKISHLRRSTGV
jgi:hypothetical protein